MNKQMIFAGCLTLAITLAASPAVGQSDAPPVSIVASVGHSEWCWPPGSVRLNLATGRYAVTPSLRWRTCRRPVWPRQVRNGILGAGDLTAVRAAYRQVRVDGLNNPACRNGGRPDTIFVSNGGRRTLRLGQGRRMLSPPADENCWSGAAARLHDLLNRLFTPRR